MKQSFFFANREHLSEAIHGGLAIFSANSSMQRSNDTAYSFTQEANFWYLTGIDEPDWWVIIDGANHKTWLVSPTLDTVHQTFDGELSLSDARSLSGITTIITEDEATSLLRELAKKHTVAYTLGDHSHKAHFHFTENPAQRQLYKKVERIFHTVQDCRLELAKLRAIKQPEEVAAIRKAIKLTAGAFETIKARLPELKYEYEVEAEFSYLFIRQGAAHAYDPIVANSKNACTLHYGKNNTKLKKNSLLLMDVGARYNGYAADITRTYAIGSLPSRHVAIHHAVQAAHHAIIKLLKPGLRTADYQESVDSIMKQALIEVGLMANEQDEEAYRRYFPHAVSHGLGIDVHDSLGKATHFEPGMILTVEPGIYIPEEGIGVRIEDDILITQAGHENLSRHLSTDL